MIESELKTETSSFLAAGTADWCELMAESAGENGKQDEARKAKDDLKDMLLASLQMENLVVLAGSGCSRSAGGPSMQDLWNSAVGVEPKDDAKTTAKKVNYDINGKNIEAFLSKVEAYLQVNQDADTRKFLDSSKQVILDKCTEFLDPAKLEAHKTLLHRLSRRRVRDQRLKVFTTNYDLCFERAAAELGGVVLDGFSFTAPRRFDPRFFTYDIIRRPHGGGDFGDYLEGVFLLHKLHGSVNWARRQEGSIYEKAKPTPTEACLIYPVAGKYQLSFVQPHLESMAQYLATVREPNTCLLALGFGFNDDHLAEPLLAAVESNPHLRLIVANPDAKAKTTNGNQYWKQFFALNARGEDVWFINASFANVAEMIPDLKSLTPADTLMKAVKGVTQKP